MVLDLSKGIVENGFNNPAFEDGRVEVCMEYNTDGWHAEIYTAATHVGTHTDAPMHRIEGGKPLSAYPLERFFGKCRVVDLRHKKELEPIDASDFDGIELNEGDFVLLFTGWNRYCTMPDKEKYLSRSPYLSPDGADYLVKKHIGAVMIDHFSIGGSVPSVGETHELLLNNDILIVEDIIVPERILIGMWSIIVAPLKLENCSGAPSRVIAFQE